MHPHTWHAFSVFLRFKLWDRGFVPCLWCRAALTSVVEVDSEKRVGFPGHAVLCAQHSNSQILILGQVLRQGTLLCPERPS